MGALALLLLFSACKDEIAAIPGPAPLTRDSLSHFCQMQIVDHAGPKAQIHLEGQPHPLFFSQVRDALAYLKGPERDARVVVVYVSDMGAAESWDAPGADNWIRAEGAAFVVGSDAIGGMGAPEIAPFSDLEDAESFAAKRGGVVMAFNVIPAEAVLGAIEVTLPGEEKP